jgi:hypothetical protein
VQWWESFPTLLSKNPEQNNVVSSYSKTKGLNIQSLQEEEEEGKN